MSEGITKAGREQDMCPPRTLYYKPEPSSTKK